MRKASQPRQDLLLNTVGEIGVIRIATQIFERQHSYAFLRDRLACLLVKRESPNDKHCNNQQQSPDDDEVEQPAAPALNRSRLYRIEIFRPDDPFGRKFVDPGE